MNKISAYLGRLAELIRAAELSLEQFKTFLTTLEKVMQKEENFDKEAKKPTLVFSPKGLNAFSKEIEGYNFSKEKTAGGIIKRMNQLLQTAASVENPEMSPFLKILEKSRNKWLNLPTAIADEEFVVARRKVEDGIAFVKDILNKPFPEEHKKLSPEEYADMKQRGIIN